MVHTTCAVKDCLSSSYLNKELRFHQFPHTEERCKDWIIKCGRPDLVGKSITELRNTHLCNLHFEPRMYGKKNLKKSAVPSLILPTSSSEQTQTESRVNIFQHQILNVPVTCITKSTTTQNLDKHEGHSSRAKGEDNVTVGNTANVDHAPQTTAKYTEHTPTKTGFSQNLHSLQKKSNTASNQNENEDITEQQFIKGCDKFLSPKLSAIVKMRIQFKPHCKNNRLCLNKVCNIKSAQFKLIKRKMCTKKLLENAKKVKSVSNPNNEKSEDNKDMGHGDNSNNYDAEALSQPTTSSDQITRIYIATSTDWQTETNKVIEEPDGADEIPPNPFAPEVTDAEQPSQKTGPIKNQLTKQTPPMKKPKEKDNLLIKTISKRLHTEPSNPKQSNDVNGDFSNDFNVFGRFVATQLKNLNDDDAVLAQSEIQEVLIRYRLNKIKTRYELPTEHTQSVSRSGQAGSQSDLATGEEVSTIVKCEPDSE